MVDPEKTDWSNLDWKSYQKTVAGLHALDEDVEVEHEYDYPVHSGGTKEMDVVVWDRRGRYTVTTLIECKFHDDSIEQEVVDSLVGVLDNSDANKGVVVSKNGFQSGAKERARGSGIELWTLQPGEKEFMSEKEFVRFDMEVTGSGDTEMHIHSPGSNSMLHLDSSTDYSIYTKNKELSDITMSETLTRWQSRAPTNSRQIITDERKIRFNDEFYELILIRKPHESSATALCSKFSIDDTKLSFKSVFSDKKEDVSLRKSLKKFRDEIVGQDEDYQDGESSG